LALYSESNELARRSKLLAALMVPIMPKGGIHIYADGMDTIKATEFLYQGSQRTKAPMAGIRIGWRWLTGPGDRLRTCTFGEFIHLEAAFSAWRSSFDVEKLDKLCAILLRPNKPIWQRWQSDYDGDARKALNAGTIQARAVLFSSVPLEQKLAVSAYFGGCMADLAKSFPLLFQKDSDGGGGGGQVWMKAVSRMANGLPHYEAVLNTRLSTALFELSQMAEDAKNMKEIYAKK
jgi:hypothetical protein